jgi:TPR repeat protein
MQDQAEEAEKELFSLLPSEDIEVKFWQAYYLYKKDGGPDPSYEAIIRSIYPLIVNSNCLDQPMKDFIRGFVSVEMKLELENINGIEVLIKSGNEGNIHAQRRLGKLFNEGEFVEKNLETAIDWFEKAIQKGDAVSCHRLAFIYKEKGNPSKEIEYVKRGSELGSPYLTAYYAQYFYDGKYFQQDYEKAFNYILKAAEMGEPQANANIGLFYSGLNEHYESKFDFDKSVSYFKKAISMGQKEAGYYLARLYFAHPDIVEIEKALELLLPLAESEHIESQYILGLFYKDQTYKSINYEQAIYWLTKAAEKNHVESQMELHGIYRSGNITIKNLKQAEYWLTKAYEHKHDLAIIYMVEALVNGAFGNKDLKKAFEILLEHKESNNGNFQNLLGAAYLKGEATELNEELAFKYFSIAVEKGDTNAMVNLGEMYLKNQSYNSEIKENKNHGLSLIEESANQNNKEASDRLGEIYEFGKFDIPKNLEKAIQWYEIAASKDHINAMLSLIELYFKEESVKNIEKGYYWLNKAAIEKGHANAQLYLGYEYLTGKNLKKDEKKGIFWVSIAAESSEVACVFLGEYYLYNAHLKNNIQQGISVLKKGIYRNNPLAMTSLGEYLIQNKPDEVKQGVQYLEKACSLDEKNACYILGMAHYKGLLFQPSKQKAYEYLKKASDLGIINNAILGILETDLEKREADHSFDKYAQELVHLEESQLKLTIQKNLEEDFGNIWLTLHPETKKFFITGLVTYRTLKKLDTNDMNLDFSSVILSFTKALENELHHYLYELYFDYIKENNIKPEDFSSIEKDNFFNKNGKLINIHQEGPNFTLGRIKYIMFTKIEFSRLMNNKINQVTKTLVGDDKLKNDFTFESGLIGNQNRQDQSTIQVTRFNSHFISFMKHLFKEDAFEVDDYDEELLGYLINFKRQVLEISDIYRNTAAHRESHSAHAAEICANWIFKKHQLLKSFLEKIKPEYLVHYH